MQVHVDWEQVERHSGLRGGQLHLLEMRECSEALEPEPREGWRGVGDGGATEAGGGERAPQWQRRWIAGQLAAAVEDPFSLVCSTPVPLRCASRPSAPHGLALLGVPAHSETLKAAARAARASVAACMRKKALPRASPFHGLTREFHVLLGALIAPWGAVFAADDPFAAGGEGPEPHAGALALQQEPPQHD